MKKESDRATEFQVDEQELQALSQRVAERRIEEKDWETIHRYLLLFLKLSRVFQYGRVRMRKIARMLFGKRTERKKKDPPDNPPQPQSSAEATPPAPAGKEQDAGLPSVGETESQEAKKGHGRRPASDYQNAETIVFPICENKAGDLCPACGKGRLRQLSAEVVIRFRGSPPITTEKYKRERVRCDTCGQVYKAELPEKAGDEKYDASAKTSIVMSKYGSGVPFYRLGMQQAQQLIPLPPGTQWELAEEVADSILPGYLELERQAAGSELLFIDDTPVERMTVPGGVGQSPAFKEHDGNVNPPVTRSDDS